jgi:hypothetical protein
VWSPPLPADHGSGCVPAQTPPLNPIAARPHVRRVLSRVGRADHAVTPQAPWTGSGWRGYSYGGFGGGHPQFLTHAPDLLIRRSGQAVQDSPSLAVCWIDVPGLSACACRCPAPWQQVWQQPPDLRVMGRTLQGVACVRSGQALAWPLVSDRSVRRGSRVKRDLACTYTSHTSPVPVAPRSQSRLRLEGRTRTLRGPSPDMVPARAFDPTRRP